MNLAISPTCVLRQCPLCGQSRFKPFQKTGQWHLVKCTACKLVMLNPQPSAGSLAELYNSTEYFAERIQKIPSAEIAMKRVEQLIPELDQLMARVRQPGRIMEIGCGYGLLLAAAERRGWEAVGLEISPHAAKFAHETFGLNVMETSAEDLAPLNLGIFDAVVMFSVIEHLREPLAVMKTVRELLTPDGVLWAVVPNLTSFDRRWHGPQWSGWDLPYHLWHYTPFTISKLLRQAGFNQIELENRFFDPIGHIRVGLKLKDFRADKQPWQVFEQREHGCTPLTSEGGNSYSYPILRKWIKRVLSGRDMKIWAR